MAGDSSALERFRAETGKPGDRARSRSLRPPVPTRQKWIVGSALVWFAVTLFWYRGGLDLAGHFTSLGLGVWTFLCLFLPLGVDHHRPENRAGTHLKRLLTLPVFWLGLLVLGYGLIQVFNTGYDLKVIPGKGGRMIEVPHIEWLPSGVNLPLDFTNSPRSGLLQLALPWLMACTLIVGLRSRRALDWLLNGAVALLAAWALMALGYYYTGASSIYWGIEMGRNNVPPFWGSLKYSNHGAILHVFGLLICLGLAGRGFRRSVTVGKVGGVQLFYLALGLLFSLATLQSLSRAGILLVVIAWSLALIGGGFLAYRARSMTLVSIFAGFFVLVFGVGIVLFALHLRETGRQNPFVQSIRATSKQLEKFEQGEAIDRREILNRISIRLFKSSPIYGYGLGSWSAFYRRHADPLNDWDIFVAYTPWARGGDGKRLRNEQGNFYRVAIPLRYDHAHNEYLQYLCEIGIVGCVPLALLVGWIPVALLVRPGRMGFIGLIAVGAAGVILLHSTIDFPTRTPSIGLLFGLLLAAGAVHARVKA